MNKDIFSNHWDNKHGFTKEEAESRKRGIDEQYGVHNPDSKWNPAVVEPDPERLDGYRIVIERKPEK